MTYQFHVDHTIPDSKERFIWVFGSNLKGRHGKGAAKVAHVNFGAPYGLAEGRMGDAYAIPTKDKSLNRLPYEVIYQYVRGFIDYAEANPNMKFFVTRVGCELAGCKDEEIAALFMGAPENCNFAEEWKGLL